jgi:hypothetical protein
MECPERRNATMEALFSATINVYKWFSRNMETDQIIFISPHLLFVFRVKSLLILLMKSNDSKYAINKGRKEFHSTHGSFQERKCKNKEMHVTFSFETNFIFLGVYFNISEWLEESPRRIKHYTAGVCSLWFHRFYHFRHPFWKLEFSIQFHCLKQLVESGKHVMFV